jgi:hypothetical protein
VLNIVVGDVNLQIFFGELEGVLFEVGYQRIGTQFVGHIKLVIIGLEFCKLGLDKRLHEDNHSLHWDNQSIALHYTAFCLTLSNKT